MVTSKTVMDCDIDHRRDRARVIHLNGVNPDSEPVMNKLFVIGLGIILGSVIVAHNPQAQAQAQAQLGMSALTERIEQPLNENEHGPGKFEEQDATQRLADAYESRLRDTRSRNSEATRPLLSL